MQRSMNYSNAYTECDDAYTECDNAYTECDNAYTDNTKTLSHWFLLIGLEWE